MRLLIDSAVNKLLRKGRSMSLYGTHRIGIEKCKEDWRTLFKLLEEGKISPIIAEKFPLLEAGKANELLESRKVAGNVVLLAPESMEHSMADAICS